MKNDIVFIAGTHGVGKSTVGKRLLEKFPDKLVHYSASDILYQENTDLDHQGGSNKQTHDDLEDNQRRILDGLTKRLEGSDKLCLFDSHFVFANKDETDVVENPLFFFEEMNPKLMILMTEEIDVLHKRMLNRDQRHYSKDFLKLLQDKEYELGKKVSEKIGVGLMVIHGDAIAQFEKKIGELLED